MNSDKFKHMNISASLATFSILLTVSTFGEPKAVTTTTAKEPSFLVGEVKGKRLSLHIFPKNSEPLKRKLKGTRFINVEPGCIIVEAYVKLVGDKKLEILMPNDDAFTSRTMKKMGVTSKKLVVTFESAKVADRAGTIVAITPIKNNLSEQDGADQPATAPESKSEGNEKPKPESEERSQ